MTRLRRATPGAFETGTRAMPAAVVANQLTGTLAPPSPPGTASGTLLAFRAPVTLAPGESVTLRYAYGMAHGDQIATLVAAGEEQSPSSIRGLTAHGRARIQ